MQTKTYDAYIERVKEVKPHKNADTLELVIVRGCQCIVQKGKYKVGDTVLYIQPDAILSEDHDKPLINNWSDSYRRYLGNRGRVKIITLRGEISNGIVVDLEDIKDNFISNLVDLYVCCSNFNENFGTTIEDFKLSYKKDLEKNFVKVVSDMKPDMLCEFLCIEHYKN